MANFEKLMKKAFKAAEKGLGYTSPNPAVGAIIVKDGRIIASGYHRKAGLPHAEIEALSKAGESARGATLISTLEPCSHFGKTPPCVDSIIAAGIKEVVGAIKDPNPEVSGRGYRCLKEAGIEVHEGVLSDYAKEFYRPYFKYITTGLPFVTLKYAQSLDGRIATQSGHSQWISSPQSLEFSHRLRAVNDAIVVGNGTLKKDNPQLTTRLVKGANPVRFIVSGSGDLPLEKSIFTDGQAPTFIVTSNQSLRNRLGQFEVLHLDKDEDGLSLKGMLSRIGEMGLMTVLVEGGSQMLTSFLHQRLADKVIVCIAPMIIGQGIEAIANLNIQNLDNSIKLTDIEITRLGPDLIVSGFPVWS